MKFLITGGLGYIGQKVVLLLKEKKHEVLVVDKNIFEQEVSFTYVEQDLGDFLERTKIKNFDAVIHLAGIVGEKACLNNPSEAFRVNYELTKKIAEECEKNKIRVIYGSTCSVYGNQEGILNEDSKTMPVDFYGQTKLLGENEIIKRENNVSLRFGTVYGWSNRMRFDLVVNKFVARAVNGLPVEVYGGKQNRPFTHVEDIARAIVFFAKNPLYRGVYNVAHENYSLNEVAKKISEIFNSKLVITQNLEDNRNYTVSNKKLTSLGFVFQRRIEDGIIEIGKKIKEEKINFNEEKYYNHLK
ncbi:MAG: NAD-dependent epimerase/dehydratase family protein [Candidatus Pacearchaeota archaeon]